MLDWIKIIRALINFLAGWFRDLKFKVEVQEVPGTRNKFNLLANIGSGPEALALTEPLVIRPF